jgi:hypothetical protein
MKSHSFLAFPISVALLWSAAGPLSYAAPTRRSAGGKKPCTCTASSTYSNKIATEVPSVLVSTRNAILETNVEELNITTVNLVRRGCFPSKPEQEDDIGPVTCDGSVPPVDELAAQIQRKGFVGNKVSAFYTRLSGGAGISLSKCWVNTHPNEIPNPPGAVFFDEIVSNEYSDAIGAAIISQKPSNLVSYQKLISQVMAEQSRGSAWIFAPADLDFNSLDDKNTWYVFTRVLLWLRRGWG